MSDPAQWFDALGSCRCGKKATGVVRGTRNESMGPYCERCAEVRIKKAQREREAAERQPNKRAANVEDKGRKAE
jgi:hypothetical protein